MLFANNEITDFDSTKNVVDVVKNDEKEIIALVIPATNKGRKKPGATIIALKSYKYR